MCAHFESVKDPDRFKSRFNVALPAKSNVDVWPTYASTFLRLTQQAHLNPTMLPESEALIGSFGLIPHWSKDTKIARHTYNARIESVAEKPAFRDAWRLKRLCIIPAEAIYEPDWRSGKAVSTKIQRIDHEPLGIAGIWTGWKSPTGEITRSFSMLTINADEHPLMRNFHKPDEEKRMVAILDESNYRDWLESRDDGCLNYIRPFPAEKLKINHSSL